eukprot:TRINITY_DN3695_c0_g1_i1.p1 TRINITY_DN3695_c0_g1~~TRINITY_DN3695_c0_g1_i1.p1  ORF type:complete len:357 (+),score=69.83 TRINITY_DN3695_c0_g1_i1:110-1180(+)
MRRMWRHVSVSAAIVVVMAAAVTTGDDDCPLPPLVSVYQPPLNTALASHPRAGSTWLRFLLERAIGLPCGFFKPDLANVLPHYGEFPEKPKKANLHGLVMKHHCVCNGCWDNASVDERYWISHAADLNPNDLKAKVGQDYFDRLQSKGICLTIPGMPLKVELWRGVPSTPCEVTFERAVLLVRRPLDNIKSNYHYRTAVLKMREPGTWANDGHAFPRERGESWVELHKSWMRFAEVRPLLLVRYEDMKQNTTRELRRIVDFLGFGNVSDARLECAVRASSMERLQKLDSDLFALRADAGFFGTRESTEQQERLSFPQELLEHFKKIGLFEVASSLGYGLSTEEHIEIDAVEKATEL